MEVEPFNVYRLCTCRDICSLAGFSLGNLKYIYVNIVLIVISNPLLGFRQACHEVNEVFT